MTVSEVRPSVLLIDDNQCFLEALKGGVHEILGGQGVDVRTWRPTAEDEDPIAVLEDHVDEGTTFVATDFDLTGSGLKGLFGPTVVGWCKQRFIPVGDFSRKNSTRLLIRPELFELRIPPSDPRCARYIASCVLGFREVGRWIGSERGNLAAEESLAAVLALLFGRGYSYSQVALYMSRLGTDHGALMGRLARVEQSGAPLSEKMRILTYLLGHVLLNMILRFPGPILSELALCAYLGAPREESERLQRPFESARYRGPFGEEESFFWREDVDEVLDTAAEGLRREEYETFGQYNRAAAERLSGMSGLQRHGCSRCQGEEGGFLCPFTERAVCHREDCAVPSSSWIPQGADLCRIEREFYDEWSPILGF